MTDSVSAVRAAASRVAKVLREKNRTPEAVLILSAGAVSGPNDVEGQGLLAEALRIDPNSEVAKAAFERMEGLGGPSSALDEAVAQYSLEELTKLERTLQPVFRRAQVGFNNNLKYKAHVFHIQTEDSGLNKPHIITHLFADGGRIIKSHKRSYAEHVDREDIPAFVRTLMKGQHMEMVLALREGRFDEVIAGRAVGGMETLERPPQVDVSKIGNKKAERSSVASAESRRARVEDAKLRVTLHVLRNLWGGPERFDPRGDEIIVGSSPDAKVALVGERFCHPHEAVLMFRGSELWVEDLEGGNGVFMRIRSRVELSEGDEFVVGDQLLRLERNPLADDGPDPGPTYFRSSLKGPSTFRVLQIFEGGAIGATAMARETTLQIGSVTDDYFANDLVFARDPLVDPYHCVIEEQAEAFVLSDFGARSGVFVRVVGTQQLAHGDELLIGRTRLLVDLSPSEPALEALG
jgi:pSer/pThr/pTyr-binding forkhead associated (FHA) protein